jgi:hypothetical protein
MKLVKRRGFSFSNIIFKFKEGTHDLNLAQVLRTFQMCRRKGTICLKVSKQNFE